MPPRNYRSSVKGFRSGYDKFKSRDARVAARRYAQLKAARSASRRFGMVTYRAPPGESKFIDFELVDTARGSGGTGELISNGTSNNFLLIPEGDGPSTRDGRQIHVEAIHIRWTVKLLDSTTLSTAPVTFRMILAIDTQCNGADPSVLAANTGIFSNRNAGPTDALAYYNLFNGKRFKIIYDKLICLNWSGAGLLSTDTYAGQGRVFKKSIKFRGRGIPVDYDQSATTGATSTIRANNLFGATMTNGTNLAHFAILTRVRYRDG